MTTRATGTAGPEMALSSLHQGLYEQIRCVLERHLEEMRRVPLTGDLIGATAEAFTALEALAEDLKIPRFDTRTPHGSLMNAVAQLNQVMPGCALRVLWNVHHYLTTSDDDGATTRQKALGIIHDVGIRSGTHEVFPPLP